VQKKWCFAYDLAALLYVQFVESVYAEELISSLESVRYTATVYGLFVQPLKSRGNRRALYETQSRWSMSEMYKRAFFLQGHLLQK